MQLKQFNFNKHKITFALLLMLPLLGEAAVPSWQILPKESQITFTATQNNSPVTGKFTSFNGDIVADPNQLDASHVRIVVDLASVSTSYSDVGDTLKTSDWFDVKMFPQAVFQASHFKKTGNNSYEADGTLTIRNKTLPVVLNFTQEEYSDQKAKIKGSTKLKRTGFGVGQGDWAKTDTVGDDVQVNFEVTAVKVK